MLDETVTSHGEQAGSWMRTTTVLGDYDGGLLC
jgi:hypothetical protein